MKKDSWPYYQANPTMAHMHTQYKQYKQYTVNSIPDIRILEGGVHKRRGQVEEEGAGISHMRPAH